MTNPTGTTDPAEIAADLEARAEARERASYLLSEMTTAIDMISTAVDQFRGLVSGCDSPAVKNAADDLDFVYDECSSLQCSVDDAEQHLLTEATEDDDTLAALEEAEAAEG